KDGAILVQYSIAFFAASGGIALVPSCAATVPAAATEAEKTRPTMMLFVPAILISLARARLSSGVPPRPLLRRLPILGRARLRFGCTPRQKAVQDECPPQVYAGELTHVAGVAEGIAARLRPYGEPVRLGADRDRGDCARCRVDRIDDIVVAPGQP